MCRIQTWVLPLSGVLSLSTRESLPELRHTSIALREIIYMGKVPATMTPQTLLNHFGSQAAIARAFNVTDAAVLKWIRAGVLPPLRVYQAKEMLKGVRRRKSR